MKFSQIFWDNDGVLVDTERYYLQASREALATIGIELSAEQFALISLTQGHSIFELAEAAGEEKQAINRLRTWRNSRYLELLNNNCLALEGAASTLKLLFGHINMAIVTSSLRQHFEAIHNQTGFLGYIDFYLTREDYKESKPSADAYLLALEKSGRKPEEVLVIEDSPRGLTAAKKAGLTCWVLPNRYNNHQQFSGADKILARIEDIPDLLL